MNRLHGFGKRPELPVHYIYMKNTIIRLTYATRLNKYFFQFEEKESRRGGYEKTEGAFIQHLVEGLKNLNCCATQWRDQGQEKEKNRREDVPDFLSNEIFCVYFPFLCNTDPFGYYVKNNSDNGSLVNCR